MVPDERPSAPRAGDDAKKVLGLSAALAAVIVVMLLAFVLPNHGSGPNAAPIGTVGVAAQQAGARLDPRGWDVRPYEDARALQAVIKDREVVGGIESTGRQWRIYTAMAAAPQVTAALTSAGSAGAQAAGTIARPVEVVPFPQGDPRGTGLAGAGLPLVFGGLLPVALFFNLLTGARRNRLEIVGVATYSLIAGFGVALFLQLVFETIDGSILLNGLGLSLGIGALAMTQLALMTAFGYVGFGIGAAIAMLVGNPLSGLASGPYWLPDGWATLGQILPPGAAGSLLRATGLFDATGALGPALILGGWLLIALATLAFATRTTGDPTPIATA
ncbi:hypothetical protein [Patulibacter sp.]|uniref:hypothetical protein n=1 Tax=Patulibacter sp. TaxID=1912859 RepID=UPI00271AE1AE|nr:hypothetical protein [Patulibacter sp.]MDO9406938.1 hypothetical protein [Patulibacter sp.]